MPRKSETETAEGTDEGDLSPEDVRASVEAGTIPYANSLSCRKCGTQFGYEESPADGVLHCPECGIANLTPDEEPVANAAD